MLQKWEHIRYFIDFSCEIFIASSVNDLILYVNTTLPIFPIGPSLVAFKKRGDTIFNIQFLLIYIKSSYTVLYRMFSLLMKFWLNTQ